MLDEVGVCVRGVRFFSGFVFSQEVSVGLRVLHVVIVYCFKL